jgi:hypothetical protein
LNPRCKAIPSSLVNRRRHGMQFRASWSELNRKQKRKVLKALSFSIKTFS